jgi:hypothetical protein
MFAFATGVINTGGKPWAENISANFRKKFETNLMVYSGAWAKLIHEKNQKSKISWHCPLKWLGYLTNVLYEFQHMLICWTNPSDNVRPASREQMNDLVKSMQDERMNIFTCMALQKWIGWMSWWNEWCFPGSWAAALWILPSVSNPPTL